MRRAFRRSSALWVWAAVAVGLQSGCARDDGDPVRWTAELAGERASGAGQRIVVRVDARMDRGWYVYSLTQPAGGPIPTTLSLADTAMFALAGDIGGPSPTRAFDNAFDMNVEKYLSDPSFMVPVRISELAPAGPAALRVNARYQACNDTICLPPRTASMTVPVEIKGR